MGGFFGVVSKKDCVSDLYFGVDYHSHLGARRGGLGVYGQQGFRRSIHNIENAPFRSKFEKEIDTFKGNLGIGCISDYEPQPLLFSSNLGSFAITTVGRVKNIPELKKSCFSHGATHFSEMSNGEINVTELMAALISQKASICEGLLHIQEVVEGSMSVLVMTKEGIYCSRDRYGRMPLIIAKKEDAYCATFESSAYMNLGYEHVKDLGPGEIAYITADSFTVLKEAREEMKMCSFMWVYYGYPTSTYEGQNVELVRNRCGELLAQRDDVEVDLVAGVPDSGTAPAIGYANAKHFAFGRPFIKYTPTWARSFMPQNQKERKLIAGKKLIPVKELIKDKRMLLIDDSIVRGTQLGETTQFLYDSGAKEVHVRPACPPIMFGCKYLNFSRSSSELALLSRRVICELEQKDEIDLETLKEYADENSEKHQKMVDVICQKLNFTSLKFVKLSELIEAIGIDKCKLCTYCWNGEE
ncbi:MAG: amidophosphoribosyltransferase [Erysipelotrichaceae bacterium]|nr:amidophosphoribosyltransferase [Erysipelotrichaceae bacterium]